MTKRFELDDFDSEVEMLELLNTQAEVISDLEEENSNLKIQVKQLNKKLNHLKNSIMYHMKHPKVKIVQKTLQKIIADYNECSIGHKPWDGEKNE